MGSKLPWLLGSVLPTHYNDVFVTYVSLQSDAELYADLNGSSLLHESIAHAFEVEGGISCVECIAYPEVERCIAFLEGQSAIERAIEVLAYAVVLCPVDASCTIVVGA